MTEDNTQVDALEGADISQEEFTKFLEICNVKSHCERCDGSLWYYLRDEGKKNMLAFLYEPFREGQKHLGLTAYIRTCLNCGNIQTFSRAVATSEVSHQSKTEKS